MLMKKIFTLLAAAALSAAPALADTAYVGDYENPNTGSFSSGEHIPFDFDYSNSYCQTLYTADMLTSLNQPVGGKATKAQISGITFKMYTEDEFLSGQKTFTIYIQNTEEISFPLKNETTPQWFTVDTSISGTAESDNYDMDEVMGEVEFTIELDNPIVYEGKSLLISWKIEGELEGMNGAGLESQVFAAADNKTHSGIKCSDSTLGIQNGDLQGPSKWLPVLKLEYTPIEDENGGELVEFDNVELKLEGVTMEDGSKANAVVVTFDVVDPTNTGKYEVFAGTQSLGEFDGTSGSVRYVPANKDLVLKIEAKGEGTTGSTYTIAADEIQALFPAPEASYTGEYALYTSFRVWIEGEGTISGAAQFQMTTTAPVARMKVTTSNNNIQMMHPGGSYSENIEALMPSDVTSANYYDYESTGGILAVYNPNLGTCKLVGDEFTYPTSVSITGQFSCVYPVVTQPTVVAGKEATTETVSGTISEISKDFENGTGYPKSAVTATMAVNDEHFVKDLEYPSKLIVKEDKQAKTLQFFAPKGESIYWILETNSRAENSWTEATTNPYTLSLENLEPGKLTVVAAESDTTPDAATVDESEKAIYTVNEDGTATSIQSIKANAAGKVEIYNLQGQRLAAPVKGINIVNGKKIIF